MSLAEMKDRAYLAAVRAVSRQMAAETVERRGHLQMPMTVTAVVEVNDAVRRLTFTAPELRDFVLGAPDEYFGLIFPRPGAVLSLPDAARGLSGGDLRVHVEVPSEAVLEGMGLEAATAAGDVTVHVRGDGTPGSAVIPSLVGSTEVEGLAYAWLCGESALATGLRRHLVKKVGMDRRQILFSGYWKLGAARG